MKKMKSVLVFSLAAAIVLIAPPVLSGDDEGNGRPGQGICRNDGAWLGESPAWGMKWIIVYDSDSFWQGPLTMRFIGGDPTMMDFFPDSVAFSDTYGTWRRTGRRTFQFTMITYGVDAAGQPVYIAKNSGSVENIGGCDYLEVYDSAISLYAGDQDPFGDDPPAFGCLVDDSRSFANRMRVDPPCVPEP
jgi:hypothetical protein